MEKIKIKCLFGNTICSCEYCIKIYDLKNNLVFSTYHNSINNLTVCLDKGFYKIKIKLKNGLSKCKVIAINGSCKVFVFQFNENSSNLHPIVLNLTDRFYPGLKIEKGEINLWNEM